MTYHFAGKTANSFDDKPERSSKSKRYFSSSFLLSKISSIFLMPMTYSSFQGMLIQLFKILKMMKSW